MGAKVVTRPRSTRFPVDPAGLARPGRAAGGSGDKASPSGPSAYVRMGVVPTFTCAPYQGDVGGPRVAKVIAGRNRNAVIKYANSVLGARTGQAPRYLPRSLSSR